VRLSPILSGMGAYPFVRLSAARAAAEGVAAKAAEESARGAPDEAPGGDAQDGGRVVRLPRRSGANRRAGGA